MFIFNIYYIKYIPTKSLCHVDDDKDYLYLFLEDVDEYIEENDRIKYLVIIEKLQKTGKKLKSKLK